LAISWVSNPPSFGNLVSPDIWDHRHSGLAPSFSRRRKGGFKTRPYKRLDRELTATASCRAAVCISVTIVAQHRSPPFWDHPDVLHHCRSRQANRSWRLHDS
jgi:hypothetical protein